MRRLIAWLVITLAAAPSPAVANSVDNDPQRQILVTVANPARPGLNGAASTWRGWNWTGGYRVSAAAAATARDLASDYDLEEIEAWPISVLGNYCLVYLVDDEVNRADVIRNLQADDRVLIAQPVNLFATTSVDASSPAEPYQALQHGLADIAVGELHSVSTGRGVRVAVIDTGAQLKHPDIRRNVRKHKDFVDRSGDEFSDDIHGTAIAGVIAAVAGNSEGILGVAPESRLLILKACWPVEEGAAGATCNSFTLARAIIAAREMKADIVNLSLAGPADPLLEQLLGALVKDGLIIVGAEPEDESSQPFPSYVDGVISVRDSGRPKRAARSSLPAPGKDIITTVPVAEYQYLSGNSMAVAHVTGIIALLRQIDGKLTPAQLERILFESVPESEPTSVSLNACNALSRVDTGVLCAAY